MIRLQGIGTGLEGSSHGIIRVQSQYICGGTVDSSGVPRNFLRGGVVQQIQLRTEWGSGGGSPLFRGSGGSCNLVQEISFHIDSKIFLIFGTLDYL